MGIDKFQQTEGLLRCPLCKDGLRMEGASLRCGKGHCFDISAKGYVCFLPGGKPSGRYNRAFFESRRRILEAGFYDHILEGIQSLSGLRQAKVILDTGCGEGYYAKRLREELDACVLGLDYSQDGIRLAASGGNRVCWMAADLANIPLRDHRAECVLNLFTPANYGEFGRVLATSGLLVKAIPGPEHLAELREQVRGRLRRVAHSEQPVASYFAAHFHMEEQFRLTRTLPLSREQLPELLRMTPLMFGLEPQALLDLRLPAVTIDAELLIGRAKR